jgi:hypothetical protein
VASVRVGSCGCFLSCLTWLRCLSSLCPSVPVQVMKEYGSIDLNQFIKLSVAADAPPDDDALYSGGGGRRRSKAGGAKGK